MAEIKVMHYNPREISERGQKAMEEWTKKGLKLEVQLPNVCPEAMPGMPRYLGGDQDKEGSDISE